jgi:crotonobetainyl-CoA:carnitine CoA-transferase CaiB-like acyl-CoA transferase
LTLAAPLLGEHNSDVLSGHLGYSAERVAALEAAGVLCRGER